MGAWVHGCMGAWVAGFRLISDSQSTGCKPILRVNFKDVGFCGGVAVEGDAGGGIHVAGGAIDEEKLRAFALPDAGAVDGACFWVVGAGYVVVEPVIRLCGFSKLKSIFRYPVESTTFFNDAMVVGCDEVDVVVFTVVGVAVFDALFVGGDRGGLDDVGAFKFLGDSESHFGAFGILGASFKIEEDASIRHKGHRWVVDATGGLIGPIFRIGGG